MFSLLLLLFFVVLFVFVVQFFCGFLRIFLLLHVVVCYFQCLYMFFNPYTIHQAPHFRGSGGLFSCNWTLLLRILNGWGGRRNEEQ